MILWTSKEKQSADPTSYCSAWRNVLEISWFHLAWTCQFKRRTEDTWSSSHTGGWSIVVCKGWVLGDNHVYYDGEHCGFGLGWLKINWTTIGCKKCMPNWDSPEYDKDWHEDDLDD